jgi:hypothetical protein
MKIHFLLLSFLFLSAGCIKKAVEQAQENIVIKAMTDGQWRVTHFDKAGTDMTADFTAYSFQFHADNTVDAINNGAVEKTGTWAADPNARTITSTFTNASPQLSLLNGTWKITDNSWTYVVATQTVNGEVLSLRIDK